MNVTYIQRLAIAFGAILIIRIGFLLSSHYKSFRYTKSGERLDEKLFEREREWLRICDEERGKPSQKRFPDVICIGMEKCGTTALIRFLLHHPLVQYPPNHQEPHYFDAHYNLGKDTYLSWMPNVTVNELVLEKTPSLFNFPLASSAASRIKLLLPDVKLMLVLCDPVKRAYSDFVHEKVMGAINSNQTFDHFVTNYLPDFSEELKYLKESSSRAFLMRKMVQQYFEHIFIGGLYYYFIEHWYDVFGPEQILVINGEDLMLEPGTEMQRVQKFLGLPELLLPEDFQKNPVTNFYCYQPKISKKFAKLFPKFEEEGCMEKSKGRTRSTDPVMTNATLLSLEKFYKNSTKQLYNFLEKDFGW